jgi:hypothetical protein
VLQLTLFLSVICFQLVCLEDVFGQENKFEWRPIASGLSFGRYELGAYRAVIQPEVYLFKFSPKNFEFVAAAAPPSANAEGPHGADVRTITKQVGGVAGINANFFDENGQPLGLFISNSQLRHKLHRGGRVLTGIFSIRKGQPSIELRDNFTDTDVTTAIQAGPRLVEHGAPIQITSADDTSRRSGIAITKQHEVILYATLLRFPGASLKDIQQMLLDPALEVSEALNLDGGGSSQLFVESFPGLQGETFISGGDPIPVGIVVKRKGQ